MKVIVKRTLKGLLVLLNLALDYYETVLISKKKIEQVELTDNPPIFIVGAPRSGSTLLYQVLTNYYDIGYISNFHALFFGSPSLLEVVLHPLKYMKKKSKYTSYHGTTKGLTAPSECGEFWYRFFRRKPSYVPLEAVDSKKLIQLRNSVASLTHAFGKPILFKNLYCSLRLQPIATALPESLFIVIHRDLIDNGHSLLEGRKKVHGDYNIWWSAEPPDVEQLKDLPPHQQVVEQICHIYKLIEHDKQTIGNSQFIHINYEDFCDAPYNALDQIDKFFQSHNLNVKKRIDISEIPNQFETRNKITIDEEIYLNMVNYATTKC